MEQRRARRGLTGRVKRLILAALAAALSPCAAAAQPTVQFIPSIAFMNSYDDNVFLTSSAGEPDVITRVTPGIALQVDRPLETVKSHYRIDAERYVNHPSLTTANGRHDAAFDIRSKRIRGAILAAEADFATTNTPNELNTLSGLTVGRARASRLNVNPSVLRELDRNTSIKLAYAYARDRIQAGPSADTHGAIFGLEHRRSPRQKITITYGAERFVFDQARPTISQTSTVGVEASGRSSSFTIAAGARLTGSQLSPEIAAAARRALRRGELSLAYTRTRTTVIGVFGAVDTQTLAGAAALDFRRALRIQAAPGISTITLADRPLYVFRLAMEASAPIGGAFALVAASSLSSQHFIQGGVDDSRSIALSHRVVSIGLRVSPSTTIRE